MTPPPGTPSDLARRLATLFVVEVLIAGEVERRHQLSVARRADQEVDVRGAHAVPLLRHDELPDRTVQRDEVAERLHRADEIVALGVALEDAAALDLLDALLD